MRTRNCDYFDSKNNVPMYGVEVEVNGRWLRVAKDGAPAIFSDPAERDALRKDLRKRKKERAG